MLLPKLYSPLFIFTQFLYLISYEKIHECLLQNSLNKLLAKLERRIRFPLISVFGESNSNKNSNKKVPIKLAKLEKIIHI